MSKTRNFQRPASAPLAGTLVLLLLTAAFGCASDPGDPAGTGGRVGTGRGGAGNGGGGNGAGGTGAGGSGAGGMGAGGSGGSNPGTGGTLGTGGMPMLGMPAGTVDVKPVECATMADAGGFTFDKIAPWRDDAKAAYTMVHDDMCGGALRGIDLLAVPALALRGLTAAVAPYVKACKDSNLWGIVKDAEAKGNEIANHSFTHPNITLENAATEVVMAKKEFDAQITNPVTFYIFPYDYWTPATLAAVKAAGHIGARAGSRDDNDGFTNPPINTAEPGNDMELEFDVWPRTYSKYASFPEKDILNVHVYNAIEKGGFALREFHSVSPDEKPPQNGSQGFGPVPLRIYEAHLDFLYNAWKANQVWTSTPSTIIRYRQARKACQASVTGTAIAFNASAPACKQFATPISVIVKTGKDVPGLKATQMGKAVATRKLGPSLFSVTADPNVGNVDLAGCMTPSPAVDASIMLPPKPMPAASVCDLELVKGVGMPGKMDDLERLMEQLQILPNPAQGDGRNGSWSWYPGGAMVSITKDGTANVLRYAGTALKAWSGVTLAFLGGNGAGTCYDATAYKGISFKIRGTVATLDATLASKVIVSLVTAETQTQKYGGDLKGEGGHFNKVIPVTAAWQTVRIAWTEFMPPTWGATATLTALATGKLQAIDWGVSDMSSQFEIFLDDIELF